MSTVIAVNRPVIHHSAALRVAAAAIAEAEALGIDVCVAVVDSSSRLVACLRMPNAFLISDEVSVAKAKSVASAAGLPADHAPVDHSDALGGRGMSGRVDGRQLVLGNHRLIEERGQCSPALEAVLRGQEAAGRSVTVLADEHQALAWFAVADTVKPHAAQAVAALRALGLQPVMLSGDNAATVRAVAAQAGIEQAEGDLLPADKLARIEALQKRHGPTAMAGDGINDAPALARSDIGIAMGAAGTDIAAEAADIVVMNDDLGRIAETVRLSRRTHAVLWQNISLALGIKAAFLLAAVLGGATMWMAVFADMGASLLVVANGLRLLRHKP